MGPNDSGQKILGLLKRARESFPEIQERAIESGDFSEVDQASRTMDRLSSLASKFQQSTPIAQEQASPVQTSPAASQNVSEPPAGSVSAGMAKLGKPPVVDWNALLPQPGAAQAPAVQEAPDPRGLTPEYLAQRAKMIAAQNAQAEPSPAAMTPDQARFGASGVTRGDEPVTTTEAAQLSPEDIKANREKLYSSGYGELFPKPEPSRAEKADALMGDIDKMLGHEEYFNDLKKLQDEEARRNAEIPKAPFDIMSLPPSPEPVTEKDVPAVAAEAQKAYGSPEKMIDDMGNYITPQTPTFEQEYLARLKAQGLEPKKKGFSWEKLLVAALYGMGSIFSRWATGNWRAHGTFPEFDKEEDEDRAARERIANQVYATREARGRAEIGAGARTEAAKTNQEGRMSVEQLKEKGKGERQDKQLSMAEKIANIKAATAGGKISRLSPEVQARLKVLDREYQKEYDLAQGELHNAFTQKDQAAIEAKLRGRIAPIVEEMNQITAGGK